MQAYLFFLMFFIKNMSAHDEEKKEKYKSNLLQR